jgi:type IV pilus assembly protein PilE
MQGEEHNMNRHKGFSLIELMVTVAIIAILASIAYPAYQDQVRKTRRADGKAKLMEVMQAQERNYTLNHTYVADLTALGYAVNGDGKAASEEGFYIISASACGASPLTSCIQLTAEAIAPQTADGNLTLDSVGNKTPVAKW